VAHTEVLMIKTAKNLTTLKLTYSNIKIDLLMSMRSLTDHKLANQLP